jgi:hypothetical protein
LTYLPAARIEVHEDGRYYVVQRGDTLRGIAARLLGDESVIENCSN